MCHEQCNVIYLNISSSDKSHASEISRHTEFNRSARTFLITRTTQGTPYEINSPKIYCQLLQAFTYCFLHIFRIMILIWYCKNVCRLVALWVLTNSWSLLAGWNCTMMPGMLDVSSGWAVGGAATPSFVAQRSSTDEVDIKVDAIVCRLEMLRNVWRWRLVDGVSSSFVSVGFVIISSCVVQGNTIVDVKIKVGTSSCELEALEGELSWDNDVWRPEVI